MSELQAEYNGYKSTLQRVSQKISELQDEAEEHRIVIATLEPLDKDRRCLRMVGGVLVDRTVGEITPILIETKEGLEQAVGTLQQDMKKTEQDLESWKTKHNVKIVST